MDVAKCTQHGLQKFVPDIKVVDQALRKVGVLRKRSLGTGAAGSEDARLTRVVRPRTARTMTGRREITRAPSRKDAVPRLLRSGRAAGRPLKRRTGWRHRPKHRVGINRAWPRTAWNASFTEAGHCLVAIMEGPMTVCRSRSVPTGCADVLCPSDATVVRRDRRPYRALTGVSGAAWPLVRIGC